jgi:hypothetical protein
MMHVFVRPHGIVEAPRDIQLCCRRELHVVIPSTRDGGGGGGGDGDGDGDGNDAVVDGILEGDVVRSIIQDRCVPDGTRVEVPARQIVDVSVMCSIIQDRCVPDGIRVEVPARQIVDVSDEPGLYYRVAVFLVAYCGERHHVTREMADSWRENAKLEVSQHIPLRENQRGRLVSRPFPYPALYPEIKYRHVWVDHAILSTNP